MNAHDRQQAIVALMALVTALFVASGYPPASRWRRQIRGAAIVLFLVALAIALIEVGIWLAGGYP